MNTKSTTNNRSDKEAVSNDEITTQDIKEQNDDHHSESEQERANNTESIEKVDNGTEKDFSAWTPVWDDNAKAYYWWNTVTNETTWNDPNPLATGYGHEQNDSVGSSFDPETKRKLEAGEELTEEEKLRSYTQQSGSNYPSYYPPTQDYSQLYSTQAHFNARTGKFTTHEDVARLNPENLSIENRATRQMQFYFDVDAYTEQRNRQRLLDNGTKRKLTRKEVERFKKKKQEKKNKRAREWLLQ
ncbi:hypothetical protein G6F57_003977 [Rhizopus arrhizus]|jgi:hypothetical protein|uniref:WW domain-containing protein n=1 Tax=Rhizopus oryzae TaxID=64495 RepID=A0A9P6XEF4_RHIOR|nr:hypothetical protein G6F30_004248 [Rhizopus arrhizus]KAG1425376.1 hypothetical protein G6F58_001949 [Rhizopus delemar]KAG0984497.1 hypothetical protein G6F29_004729 [Rhizopus arrhizus]KAG0995355.1 hypothetical protein G6F28_004866 [Rhizopus arrhizus]KAG1010121.1 hypothetical protein G6F27_004950 [Rhizopus arrhizus]